MKAETGGIENIIETVIKNGNLSPSGLLMAKPILLAFGLHPGRDQERNQFLLEAFKAKHLGMARFMTHIVTQENIWDNGLFYTFTDTDGQNPLIYGTTFEEFVCSTSGPEGPYYQHTAYKPFYYPTVLSSEFDLIHNGSVYLHFSPDAQEILRLARICHSYFPRSADRTAASGFNTDHFLESMAGTANKIAEISRALILDIH